MRADEYIVDEYMKLKKENQELKAVIDDLQSSNTDYFLKSVEKDKDTETIKIEHNLFEIYHVIIQSKYRLEEYLRVSKEEGLNKFKTLLDSNNIYDFLQFMIDESYYSDKCLVTINPVHCQHKLTYLEQCVYLRLTVFNNEMSVNPYSINAEYNFETYEDACNYAIQECKEKIAEIVKQYKGQDNA